jgi:hypothetical protein
MSTITRTTKSLLNLSLAVKSTTNIDVSVNIVARYLHANGYSLQMNKKMIE